MGGKVLDAEYQKLWLDSPQIENPEKPAGQWYGYGITRQTWGSNNLIYHGGETAGYNSKMAVETTNDVTLVLWTNLTLDVKTEQQTANTLMLKVLDQIMVESPLAITAADVAAPPTTG